MPFEAIAFEAFPLAAFTLHALLAGYPRMLSPLVPVVIWFVVLVASSSLRIVGEKSSDQVELRR